MRMFNTFLTFLFYLEELKYGESKILKLFQCQSLSMESSIWETLTLSCRFVISSSCYLLLKQNEKCAIILLYLITLCYVQTTQNKGGAYLFDIHFWIGKDTSQVPFVKHSFLFLVDVDY